MLTGILGTVYVGTDYYVNSPFCKTDQSADNVPFSKKKTLRPNSNDNNHLFSINYINSQHKGHPIALPVKKKMSNS